MCTVSWCRQKQDHYSLFFNRDESKQRLPALTPSVREANGVTFVSPTDADQGGTWLLSNNHGITIGLLNHYAASRSFTPDTPTSRGHLVLSLAGATNIAAIESILTSTEPTNYRPFLVFAVTPIDEKLWIWDGHSLHCQPPQLPLTTSSYQTNSVTSWRRDAFSRLGSNPSKTQLSTFHQLHDPTRPEFSIRMRRHNARTVSHSRIDVSPDTVSFCYRPEPNDSLTLFEETTVSIPRA